MQLVTFLTAERFEQLHLGRAGDGEGLDQCSLAPWRQGDDDSSAIAGVAPTKDKTLLLEPVENSDQVRRMDAKGPAESELRVWAGLPQAVQYAELLGCHAEAGKRVTKPRTGDLRELRDQQARSEFGSGGGFWHASSVAEFVIATNAYDS